MPALQFILTTAGKNAIVNANNTGTNPITIAKVGIGSASWTPTAAATALNTEIKKLTAVGGGAVADDTIHVTANDSSTDAYTVREIGLFTADNILVAVYSQADAIIVKGAGTVALIATDLVITGVPAGSVTVGDTTFDYPQATETVKGVAEIATDAEVTAGTDNERIVTPAKLAARYVKKSGDTMTGPLSLPGDPSASLHATTKEYVDRRTAGDTIPIGTVAYFSAATAPDSWLACHGQAVSRTEYDVLFARIGTTYGAGNGSTTFNVPDLRGEFIRGLDSGRGVDVGRQIGSFQDGTHITGDDAFNSVNAIGNMAQNSFDPGDGVARTMVYTATGVIVVNQAGGFVRVRPRNVALLPCIKAKTLSQVDAALLGQAQQIYVRLVGDEATTTKRGIIELATFTEVQDGTDLERAVTPAGLNSRTATDARTGIVELATAAEVQTGTDTSRAVTPAGLAALTATTTRAGLVELATTTEISTGTDLERAVTPNGLRLHPGVARAWVLFNGAGTVAVNQSHNVTSITDRGVGRYTANFTTAFGSSGYAFFGSARQINDVSDSCTVSPRLSETKTTSAFQFSVTEGADLQDSTEIALSFFA